MHYTLISTSSHTSGALDSYIGVGLPKVLRSCPLTLLGGDRYSFSNISGLIDTLCAERSRFMVANASSSEPRPEPARPGL